MKIGDHLISPRTGYAHHGLYIGNGEVIHYSGFSNSYSSGEITTTSVEEFSNGKGVSVQKHPNRKYDREESVSRASSRLGEDWYNVLVNNCEHFVTWCIEGFHSSSQVNNAISTIALAHEGYRAFSTTRNASVICDSMMGNNVITQIGGIGRTTLAKSSPLMSSTVVTTALPSLTGLSTVATSTALTTGVVSLATTSSFVAITTVAAPVAAAVAIGYCLKELFDW